MQRLLTALGAIGSGLLLAVACSDDKTENLFPDTDAGSLGGRTGGGGSGGSSRGVGGSGGTGGNAAGSGGSAGSDVPGGSGGQDAGLGDAGCQGALDCDDQNACTVESCAGGVCVAGGFAATGTLCGSATDDACSDPDTCDAQGICQPNHALLGASCGSGGSCTEGQCVGGQAVDCPVDVATTVPFNTSWSSVGRPSLFGGDCEQSGTPDYALVFTAPQTGTFRFAAHALVDSTPYSGADPKRPPEAPPDGDAIIIVAAGSCAGQAALQLGCNDDFEGNIDSQLDLQLEDQQQVTVYLNERTQTGGGTGTLSITLRP